MKNLQRGFIVPLLIIILSVLTIGSGVYFYLQNKTSHSKDTVESDMQSIKFIFKDTLGEIPSEIPHETAKTLWSDTNTFIVGFEELSSCPYPYKDGDVKVVGNTLFLSYKVPATSHQTNCVSYHSMVYTITNLPHKDYSIVVNDSPFKTINATSSEKNKIRQP